LLSLESGVTLVVIGTGNVTALDASESQIPTINVGG
jgi:hypothetical protein